LALRNFIYHTPSRTVTAVDIVLMQLSDIRGLWCRDSLRSERPIFTCGVPPS